MPATDINNVLRRFESGGRVELTSGADNYNIKNIKRGTLVFKRVHVPGIAVMDRGSYAEVLEGDDTLGEISLECHAGTGTTTNNLLDISDDRDGTTNKKKMWTVDVYIPAYKGATSGIKYSFTNAWFAEPVEYKAGDETDAFALKFNTLANAQAATY